MNEHRALVTRRTCGRCGVYRHLHPTGRCDKPTLSWWWGRHYLRLHIGAWLWVHALPSRARWAIARAFADRGRDWCGLVDSVTHADQWDEYYRRDYTGKWGCLCDFPAPWQVGPPRPGYCYCCPPEAVTAP